MAVPLEAFGLTDVVTEIEKYGKVIFSSPGYGPSLQSCFDASEEIGFQGIGRDSLLDFAGYVEPDPTPPPTVSITTLTLVPDTRNRQDVTVNSNTSWVANISFIGTSDWALLGPIGSQALTYSGTGPETFDIRYDENTSGSPRYLSISIQTTAGSPTATDFVNVQQGEETGQ